MLLIVIQVIEWKCPKEQNNSSVPKASHSTPCPLWGEGSTCWRSAARTRRSCRAAGAWRSAAAPRSARRTSPAPRPRARTAPAPRCICTPPTAEHVKHSKHSSGEMQVSLHLHEWGYPCLHFSFSSETCTNTRCYFLSHSDNRVWNQGGQYVLTFKNHRFLTLVTLLFCNNCEAILCAFLHPRKHKQSTHPHQMVLKWAPVLTHFEVQVDVAGSL